MIYATHLLFLFPYPNHCNVQEITITFFNLLTNDPINFQEMEFWALFLQCLVGSISGQILGIIWKKKINVFEYITNSWGNIHKR